MHALDTSFVRVIAFAAAFLLEGCLVSETPLLNESNGRARPIEAGLYQSCSYSDGELDGECGNMRVSVDDTRLYSLVDDDDDVTFVRFRKFARGGYLVQTLSDGDDDGYMYFVASPENGGLRMTMILCPDLPEELKSDLVANGEMELESDGEICVAKTLAAALGSAKIYHGENAPPARTRLELTATTEARE